MDQEHAQGSGGARNASGRVLGAIKQSLSTGLDTVCPAWGASLGTQGQEVPTPGT